MHTEISRLDGKTLERSDWEQLLERDDLVEKDYYASAEIILDALNRVLVFSEGSAELPNDIYDKLVKITSFGEHDTPL